MYEKKKISLFLRTPVFDFLEQWCSRQHMVWAWGATSDPAIPHRATPIENRCAHHRPSQTDHCLHQRQPDSKWGVEGSLLRYLACCKRSVQKLVFLYSLQVRLFLCFNSSLKAKHIIQLTYKHLYYIHFHIMLVLAYIQYYLLSWNSK